MIKLTKPVIKLKNKGKLLNMLFHEDYNYLAVYSNGKWDRRMSSTAHDKEMVFRRADHYGMTKAQCKSFIGAIGALLNGNFAYYEYIISLIRK